MGAIPKSDTPSYKQLHDRIHEALDLCKESPSIEFKESQSLEVLKWKIIRTAIAMGNLRDGGLIIIGASSRGDDWDLTGMEAEHLQTYDVDDIIDLVNKYASPSMDPDVVRHEYRNKNEFLVIHINGFDSTPYVCKKNGPDGVGLQEGTIYLRPTSGKAQTTKLTHAEQLHDLLETASEKRTRKTIESLHNLGLIATLSTAVPTIPSTQAFEDELEGL